MKLTLKEASEILGITQDELMFLNQKGKIQARVNNNSLAWEFLLPEILALKATLELEK